MSESESLRFSPIPNPDPAIKAGDVIRVIGVEGVESFLVTEAVPEEGDGMTRVSGIAWPPSASS